MDLDDRELKERVARTMAALKHNEFLAFFFPSSEEAATFVDDSISPGALVGVGGSLTIRDMGLLARLKNRGIRLLDHWDTSLSLEQVLDIRKQQLTCDVFLCSVNAITEKGELVSRDGIGNRICAMTFGPEKVFVVAGVHKIVKDLHAAVRRVREVAAPRRAESLNMDLPCTRTAGCVDCDEPQRICRATMILHKRPALTDITVVLVGEELGY